MFYNAFTLILSAITAASTIAAFFTCFISYKTTRPNIKVIIDDSLFQGTTPQSFFSSFKGLVKEYSFAKLSITIENRSPILGTIADLYVEYCGKKYYSSSIYTEPSPELQIKMEAISSNEEKIDPDLTDLKSPICIAPYFSLTGFITIPNFAFIEELPNIKATFCYRIIGKNKKYRIPITLYRKSPSKITHS